MKAMLLKSLSVIAVIATGVAARADTLEGPPIAVAKQYYRGLPVENTAGNVGLTFDGGPLSYAVFNTQGQKKGRAEISSISAAPQGTLALEKGGALVGFLKNSELCARRIYQGEILGGERCFSSDQRPSGGYLVRSGDAGFAFPTTVSSDFRKLTVQIRKVSRSGVIGPVVSQIAGKDLEIVTPRGSYVGGFIVKRMRVSAQADGGYVTAQVYGENGRPVGAAKVLERKPSSKDGDATDVYDLSDGSIVVIRQRRKQGTKQISAEVYDRTWTIVKDRTVLAAIQADQQYRVEPLASGGFALAIESADGRGFTISRYLPTLVAASDPLTVTAEGVVHVAGILGRTQGDMFVLYNSTVSGQTSLFGQFIKP